MSWSKKPCCQAFPNPLLQLQSCGENEIAGQEGWLPTNRTQGLPACVFYTEKDLKNSSLLFFIHPLIFTISYSQRDFNAEVNTHLNPFIHLLPQRDSWPSPLWENTRAVTDCSASNHRAVVRFSLALSEPNHFLKCSYAVYLLHAEHRLRQNFPGGRG